MINDVISNAVKVKLNEAGTLDSVSEFVSWNAGKSDAANDRLRHDGWRPQLQMPRSIRAKLKD
jgi:hypothetical protein